MDLVFKKELHKICLNTIEEKIKLLVSEIEQIQADMNSETKSSAGDKYETGREMLQSEMTKKSHQMEQALKDQRLLRALNTNTRKDHVEQGSLVKTLEGNYYIAAPIGSLDIKETKCFAISAVSPLAQAMMGLRKGDEYLFRGVGKKIVDII